MSEHDIHEAFIRSGSTHPLPEFSAALSRWLGASPDAAMALNNLSRFLGATLSTASLFNDILQYPLYGDLLFAIFGSSHYFADVIVREPGLFRWLTTSDALTREVTPAYLRGEMARILETFARTEKRLDAIKRLHRRELLRIGAQDLMGHADLRGATRQLSALADAVVQGALQAARDQMGEAGQGLTEIPFCVIGLGKLGGSELNYSSDIDVVFVYAEDGESAGGRTAHEYFNKIAERLVGHLTATTAEGHLYRVDTRLRPDAGAGTLAMSAAAMLTYYESRGELWERQMLIKARPVAGSLEFGEEFLARLDPFVYPRTLFEHPGASVARIKGRIEAAIGGEENVKLMPGGIRDIEFIVQTLQLLNGGRNSAVRERGTLQAIERLRESGLLSPEEAPALRDAYTLYRTLEHRLQTMLNTQTHTLPEERSAVEALARRSGIGSADELRKTLDRHRRAVRRIFTQVMTVPGDTGELGLAALADGGVEEGTAAALLTAHGFRDGRRAARNVRLLSTGTMRPHGIELDGRTREMFRSVAGPLLEEMRQSPDPDLTLSAFSTIAGAQKDRQAFFRQLADPRFRKFVLTICAGGERFARGLGRDPLLLETLASDSEALAGGTAGALPPDRDLVGFRFRQELRAGIRHQLGFTGFDQFTDELSSIASFVVSSLWARIARQGRRRIPLAVFALGKLGTGELGLDGDLDLMFVAGASEGGEAFDQAGKGAEKLMRELTAVSPAGRLYDIDARLRPEGKSAPLVAEAGAYAKYLGTRASLWERQSLTRLRFITGDQTVGKYVADLASHHAYDTPLAAGWTESIVAMRRKMETRSRTRVAAFIDLKLGPGGMADCEFIAQMIQLKCGGRHQELRGNRTVAVLRSPAHGMLKPDEAEHLASSYGMFRRLEFLMRTGLEEKGSILPEGEPLNLLGRLYDGSSGQALASRLAGAMKRVRSIFLEIAGRLA